MYIRTHITCKQLRYVQILCNDLLGGNLPSFKSFCPPELDLNNEFALSQQLYSTVS